MLIRRNVSLLPFLMSIFIESIYNSLIMTSDQKMMAHNTLSRPALMETNTECPSENMENVTQLRKLKILVDKQV